MREKKKNMHMKYSSSSSYNNGRKDQINGFCSLLTNDIKSVRGIPCSDTSCSENSYVVEVYKANTQWVPKLINIQKVLMHTHSKYSKE